MGFLIGSTKSYLRSRLETPDGHLNVEYIYIYKIRTHHCKKHENYGVFIDSLYWYDALRNDHKHFMMFKKLDFWQRNYVWDIQTRLDIALIDLRRLSYMRSCVEY